MYRLLHLHSVEAIASNYSRTAGGLRNYIPNRLPVSCISNQFIGVRLDARRERERDTAYTLRGGRETIPMFIKLFI